LGHLCSYQNTQGIDNLQGGKMKNHKHKYDTLGFCIICVDMGRKIGQEEALEAIEKEAVNFANPCMKCGSVQCAICWKDWKKLKSKALKSKEAVLK
jgi:hypothetical protein